MNGYERIINLMRQQGATNNPIPLQLGEMASATNCYVGDLKLDKDDFLVADHLTEKTASKVTSKLKKGDTVLVQRMSDEQYVIIERLVEL
jgi:hypothetical protein